MRLVFLCVWLFVLFKQKTAYEMRISDWSSDVCSSDRVRVQTDGGLKTGLDVIKAAILGAESFGFGTAPMIALGCKYLRICHLNNCATGVATQDARLRRAHFNGPPERVMAFFRFVAEETRGYLRSEEHTSELQSLMRISYAVFCLKKKKKQQINIT